MDCWDGGAQGEKDRFFVAAGGKMLWSISAREKGEI